MKILFALVQLLPVILQAIMGVEEVIGAGNGSTKKQMVLDSIQAVAKAGESVPNGLVSAVSGFIDSTVGNLNSSGIFKKSGPAVVTSPLKSIGGIGGATS